MVVQLNGLWSYNYRVYGCTTERVIVVQLKGVWLYDYRVYGCTTIRVVVVRLKGVVTRLGRPADCSRQSC